MWDHEILKEVYHEMPGDSTLHNRAKWTANEMMNVFREGELSSLPDVRKTAERVYGKDWEKTSEDESKDAGKQQGTLWAIGHW